MERVKEWRDFACGFFCVAGGARMAYDGALTGDGVMFPYSMMLMGILVHIGGWWLGVPAFRSIFRR